MEQTMTEDDFEDILDQVHLCYPLIADDKYVLAEYQRAIARVSNTGGEEQRARLQDLLDELESEAEQERAEFQIGAEGRE